MFDEMSVWFELFELTNLEAFVFLLIILITLLAMFHLIVIFKKKVDHFETMYFLTNAAFNNHLRNYHGVDIHGGDEYVSDK